MFDTLAKVRDAKRQRIAEVLKGADNKAQSSDTALYTETREATEYELARKPGGSSKFAGVTFHKSSGRWQAGADGKYLGLHESEELAAEARQKYLRDKIDPPSQSTPEKKNVPQRKSKVQRSPEQPKLQDQVFKDETPASTAMDFLDKFKHEHDKQFSAPPVSPVPFDVSALRTAEPVHAKSERVCSPNTPSQAPLEAERKVIQQSSGAASEGNVDHAIGKPCSETQKRALAAAEDEEEEAPLVKKPSSGLKAEKVNDSTPNSTEKSFAARKSRTSMDNRTKSPAPKEGASLVEDQPQLSSILTASVQEGFQKRLANLECLSFSRK
jgi:hypothetical protein